MCDYIETHNTRQEPFLLIPWREVFRGERFDKNDTRLKLNKDWISIYPVLAAHADRRRIAWPSHKTIAILAGMRPKKVPMVLDELHKKNWIEFGKHRNKEAYRLSDLKEIGEKSIKIGRAIVMNGLWAKMSHTMKITYICLLAHTKHPAHAIGMENEIYDRKSKSNRGTDNLSYYTIKLPGLGEFKLDNLSYVPEWEYEPGKFAAWAGIDPRSWRREIAKLMGNGLIFRIKSEDCEDFEVCEPGFIIPLNPQKKDEAVLNRLKKLKSERQSAASKRSSTWAAKAKNEPKPELSMGLVPIPPDQDKAARRNAKATPAKPAKTQISQRGRNSNTTGQHNPYGCVFELPTKDGPPFKLTAKDVAGYGRIFPKIDFMEMLGVLKKELDAHPDKRQPRRTTNNLIFQLAKQWNQAQMLKSDGIKPM